MRTFIFVIWIGNGKNGAIYTASGDKKAYIAPEEIIDDLNELRNKEAIDFINIQHLIYAELTPKKL